MSLNTSLSTANLPRKVLNVWNQLDLGTNKNPNEHTGMMTLVTTAHVP